MLLCLALVGVPITGCSDDDDSNSPGANDSGTTGSNDAGTTTRNDGGSTPADGGMDASLDAATDSGAAKDANASGDAAATALTDAQVVGVAAALNTGEINAGTLAQTKTTADSAARNFAAMMVTMHTAAQARQTALGITPASSTVQAQVTTMAMTALQNLQSVAEGSAFDRAYIQSQVEMHTSARDLIDSTLLPSATTAALRDELTRTRGEVVMHLSEAVSILSALSDGGVTFGDAGSADAGNDAGDAGT